MAQLQTDRARDPRYILGHSNHELDSLIERARFFGDLTEHLLRLAGTERGMRVLDVGCGPGDVSFLAARLVGPAGAVIGADKSAEAIRVAQERARAAGLTNVRFVVQDAAELDLDEPVDAIVGRLVLTYFAEPAAVVRRLVGNLRPGGIVAFQEMDMQGATSEPPCPLFEAAIERIHGTFARAGNDRRAGLKLWRIFREAGLPAPQMLQQARVEGGPDSPAYAVVEQITRTLLPHMERLGVATAAEVEIETLAARLRDEAVALDAVMVLPPLIGAWVRTGDGRA